VCLISTTLKGCRAWLFGGIDVANCSGAVFSNVSQRDALFFCTVEKSLHQLLLCFWADTCSQTDASGTECKKGLKNQGLGDFLADVKP